MTEVILRLMVKKTSCEKIVIYFKKVCLRCD